MSNCFFPIEWDLPEDILVDILRRIPAISLARCSCVAKSWRDVTKNEHDLNRKIGLERAWVHDPAQPIIHKDYGEVFTFCFDRMENLVALGGPYRFKVLDFDTGKIVFDCDETGSVQSLSFMDGMLLSGGCDGNLCGWDVTTWSKLFSVSILDCYIFSIADLGDGVAVGGFDGDLEIWKKGVWKLERSLRGHTDNVYQLVHEEGNLLISGSLDETVRIWNLDDHTCIRVISGQKEGTSSLVVSDGVIFCGANDGKIRSWKLENGKHLETFEGHSNSVTSLALNGGRVFSGSHDGTVKMWDATKGVCVRSFDCSYEEEKEVLEVLEVVEVVDVFWVDEEKMIVVNGHGEIWEWDFSKGL